ncbi:MAG: hypothetical protein WCL32_26125, partial [Planctomycetota bacterium]
MFIKVFGESGVDPHFEIATPKEQFRLCDKIQRQHLADHSVVDFVKILVLRQGGRLQMLRRSSEVVMGDSILKYDIRLIIT